MNFVKFRILIAILLICSACVYHDLTPAKPQVPRVICDTISWTKHVLPIVTKSCATRGCHDGKSRLDWRDYNTIIDFAAEVKSYTSDQSMPPEETLTASQIKTIACWVENGAPEN